MEAIAKPRTIVRVSPSRFGHGVMACRNFRKGTLVGRIRGELIDDPDYESNYCINLGGSLSLEPAAPFRFLNHSCEPNCRLLQGEPDRKGTPRLWLETRRAIKAGEELTIDYAWPATSAMVCGCGTPKCRGWIVDKKELKLLATRSGLSKKSPC